MKKILKFLKKDVVLWGALLLAVLSSFVILPDSEYIGYIDFRTLAILFGLMAVMAGLQKIGFFRRVAEKLLERIHGEKQLIVLLLLLCFGFGMFITNDVALITFVPFTFTVLSLTGEERKNRLMVPVVVMQTLAANMGSMLTPIGNPQNLYLYGKSGISLGAFLLLMLPYTLCALVLLLGWCVLRRDGSKERITISFREQTSLKGKRKQLIGYFVLFLINLLAVSRILPWQAAFVLTLAGVALLDYRVLRDVDYALLLTFVGFFVFIGNMGRVEGFRSLLQGVVTGHETVVAIAASQCISNVPAALLLSGFTKDYGALIVGTNLGGLGTLIASMASLISYKYIVREEPARKGNYLVYFTVANVCFLIVMLVLNRCLN